MKRLTSFLLLALLHLSMAAQNVGIGTTTPAFKLDVNGRMRVKTGTLGNVSSSSGIWMEDYRTGDNRVFVGMQDSIRVGFYGTGASGIGWGFNFNANSGNVAITSGSLGIGTISPAYDMHLYKPNPSIGFYDSDANDHFAGSIEGNDQDILINAYRRPNVLPSSETSGNVILQVNTIGPFVGSIAGLVGIGTASPDTKLHVTNGTDVTLTGGGYLQLGFTDNSNVAFDNNEIQARLNGQSAKLTLQNEGGGLQIGSGEGVINITSTGELNRNSITGTANLLPLAFGRVAANGTLFSSTGNFTVQKGVEGEYLINLTDESNLFQNRNNYVIMVTPNLLLGLNAQAYIANAGIAENNLIRVYVSNPRILYVNSSCSGDCGPFSYVQTNSARESVDCEFSILIYKY